MARTGSKMAQKGQKWLKMVNFQKHSHVCGVSTLTDKISKDSCQYVHSVHNKGPKCQKNNENGQF